jgi:hypothetical protein
MNVRSMSATVTGLFVAVAALQGCDDDDDGGGGFAVAFVTQVGASQTMAGGTVLITYSDAGAAGSSTDFFADQDGNLATVVDQVVIALNRPVMPGVNQSFNWDTAGVSPGVYRIVAVVSDGSDSHEFTAAGLVTVNGMVSTFPTNGSLLESTAFNIRLRFAFPLTVTPDATNLPVVLTGTGTLSGSYLVQNGGSDVVFVPSTCVFPAPGQFHADVFSSLGATASAPLLTSQLNFSTQVTKAYGIPRFGNAINVMDVVGNTETLNVPLAPNDDPFFIVAHVGGKLYVANRADNVATVDSDVIVFDTFTNSVSGRIPLSKTPGAAKVTAAGVALSPDGGTLYVCTYEGTDAFTATSTPFLNRIAVATETEIDRLPLGSALSRLRSMAISLDGLRAFVPAYDSAVVHVVNLVNFTLMDTDGDGLNGVTPMPFPFSNPAGAAMTPDGTRVIVSSSGTGVGASNSLAVYDATTFAQLAPLAAVANSTSSAPVIRINACDGRLYVPRIDYSGDALSIYDVVGPQAPMETLVPEPAGGSNNDSRDIAFVWGTNLAGIAAGDSGDLYVFDLTTPLVVGTVLVTTLGGMSGVATIPPRAF